MALGIDNHETKRPIGLVIVGVALLAIAGYLFYQQEQRKSSDIYIPSSYEYSIKQSVNTNVSYLDNSFYKNGPGPTNSAYVMELTDTIMGIFNYQLSSEDQIIASVTYDVKGKVVGKYAIESNENDTADVWSKEYQLVEEKTEDKKGKVITLSPSAELPYADYRKELEAFKTSLALPINSMAIMTATIRVTGIIKDIPFTDTRVITISAPLDQQIYTVSVKYDKAETKQIHAESDKKFQEQYQQYLTIFSVIIGIIGTALIIFGMRKQIFKTPYQRELEKIYRYNDGVIIRSQKLTDISGKRLVIVASFDDMLNIEEELKTPIVASPAGPEATQFMIIHSDVAYVYTLGRLLVDDSNFEEIGKEIDHVSKSRKRRH